MRERAHRPHLQVEPRIRRRWRAFLRCRGGTGRRRPSPACRRPRASRSRRSAPRRRPRPARRPWPRRRPAWCAPGPS
ncbi:MAG: hypothetical protein EXR72_25950 [Myxococcales bacterium]|nr:hypothetical protein [Myxococcales bacterium]